MKNILLIFLMTISSSAMYAQSEKDIHEKEVPFKVKEFLKEKYPEAGKIKYYKEIENDTFFYEASFKYRGNLYDLRFLMDGTLYEVERTLGFEQLPPDVQNKIREDLSNRYIHYKIRKVEEVNPQGDLRYEVNVKAKKGNHHGYFELFYGKEGGFIQEKEEILNAIPSNSGF